MERRADRVGVAAGGETPPDRGIRDVGERSRINIGGRNFQHSPIESVLEIEIMPEVHLRRSGTNGDVRCGENLVARRGRVVDEGVIGR